MLVWASTSPVGGEAATCMSVGFMDQTVDRAVTSNAARQGGKLGS